MKLPVQLINDNKNVNKLTFPVYEQGITFHLFVLSIVSISVLHFHFLKFNLFLSMFLTIFKVRLFF
jgi:hypothetical protein